MKSIVSLGLALSALMSQASGHYIFQQLTTSTKYSINQFIRPVPSNSPVTDLTSTDLRCNVGGTSGASTQTATMKAGDTFSLTANQAIYHQGPTSFYMAKVPSGKTAASFDGSGAVWFKIQDIGPTFDSSGNSAWSLLQTYSSKIPSSLPSGDYLIRIQQLAIHNPYPAGIPQFYISCAQVTVTNGGTGKPAPLVSIPGFMDGKEPGYVVNIYDNFHNYTVPGPAVWSG
ncbi:hypothetical protein HYALB_00004275 [Hymenoscyphus albidus]|uniref:AA9 family lytic polysaccharide monooxygenase n=1 Tax=Hymenoscyphus albidus TaxID=595503 RepID=A0A9N9LHC6_9HELO|nr:hypothetical protein HYALB_00004275 [Hymenoscyphus albidus]